MKKGISILLALTLIASLMASFSVAADGNLSGEGTLVTFESQDREFVGQLPTNANLDFIVDPQGLIAFVAEHGTGGNVEDAVGSNEVIFAGGVTGGDVAQAFNLGSLSAELNVALELTAPAEIAEHIVMWVEPSAGVRHTSGDAKAGDDFDGFGKVVIYGTGGETDILFYLEAVEYEIVITGPIENGEFPTELRRVDDSEDMNGTALQFGGIINPNADVWGEPIGTGLSISAVFSMQAATAPVAASVADGDFPYGWVNSFTAGDTYTAPALVEIPTEVGGSQNNAPEFAVTIVGGGTGATETGLTFAEGDTVTINAGTAAVGYVFDGWTTESGVTFADANAVSTTFEMPANAVTVTATWSQIPTQNLLRTGANRRINFDWAGLDGNSGDTARLGTVTLAGEAIAATAVGADRTAGRIVITGNVPAELPAGIHPLVINTTTPDTTTTVFVLIP